MPKCNTKCGNCYIPIYKPPSAIKYSKSGKVFCGRSCSQKLHNKSRIGDLHPLWNNTSPHNYRIRAIRHYGAICSNANCPLQQAGIKIQQDLLDVDHIDSNRSNNCIENLQVLCVYCHAKKTRLGSFV